MENTTPKWKTAFIIWLGIYPTMTILLFFIWPVIERFPLPLKTLCLTLVVLPIMVWIVLPLLHKTLHNWINKS
jgi:uncharacterized protein